MTVMGTEVLAADRAGCFRSWRFNNLALRTEIIGMNNFSKISVLSEAPLIFWPLTSFSKDTDKMHQTIAASTAASGSNKPG
jgi:hypothetical protein